MKSFCAYHPSRPAVWYCPECDVDYCPECVSRRTHDQYGKKKTFHYCPKCSSLLDSLDVGDFITPFWNRLHKFFTYPFYPQPLILMVLLGLSTLLYWMPVMGLFVSIAVYVVTLKYSFEALIKTAQGSFRPPEISSRTISDNITIVFKQICVYIILGFVLFWVFTRLGVIAGFLFLAFAVLSIPSIIIVLVTTNSLLNAINPLLFVRIAWRIGWGYLLMYLFLMLLGIAPGVLGNYIINYLPTALQIIVATMAKFYYTLISYHLMGYVILQYHQRIGYEVDMDEEELLLTGQQRGGGGSLDEDRELLNRVDVLVKGGNIDDAIEALRAESIRVESSLPLAERFYGLLRLKGLEKEMAEHGKSYLDVLARAGMKEKLCEVYQECLEKDPAFTPSSGVLFKIAGALSESGRHKEAVKAYNRFTKADPHNTLVPKAYFLGSSIINEKLGNPQKARKILNGLIRKYPDHEIVPYARNYLKQMGPS